MLKDGANIGVSGRVDRPWKGPTAAVSRTMKLKLKNKYVTRFGTKAQSPFNPTPNNAHLLKLHTQLTKTKHIITKTTHTITKTTHTIT